MLPVLRAVTLVGVLYYNTVVSAHAQGASAEERSIERRFEMMDRAEEYSKGQLSPNFWERSVSDQNLSMVGREDMVPKLMPGDGGPVSHICDSESVVSVFEQIAEIAQYHTLVIINEDHSKPHHRLFIRNLAILLRQDGFTHYAAETFSQNIADGTGGPVVSDGVFTTEPMMARLVEHTRDLGFELVPYEMRWDQFPPSDAGPKVQMATREEAQAQNIMDAVLSDNLNTKMIVHVGHGHGQEGTIPSPDFVPLMAARLKQKSGLDPLTIELTQCSSANNRVILSDTAMTVTGRRVPNLTDYWVGFPDMTFERGRPVYRYDMGDIPIEIPSVLMPRENAVVIEARPLGVDLLREPIERLYIAPGEDIPLMLPPGTWSLIAFARDGSTSDPVTVEVLEP